MGNCFGGGGSSNVKPNGTNGTNGGNVKNPKNLEEYKFLLLGSGESGKSTFHKQIRILLGETDFLQKEEGIYVNTIYANLIFTVHSAHLYFQKNNIKLSDELEVSLKILTIRKLLKHAPI